MAARQGFEPRQKEPESFVLPLHYRATKEEHVADLPISQVENCWKEQRRCAILEKALIYQK